MAVLSSPISGHSSQAVVSLSGEARSRIKKHMNKFRDDLDDPVLKTDAAFRKILEDGFFEFIAFESQALTVEEKGECQRTYSLNKRLFNHDGTPSSFILEEIRSNESKRRKLEPEPSRAVSSSSPSEERASGMSEGGDSSRLMGNLSNPLVVSRGFLHTGDPEEPHRPQTDVIDRRVAENFSHRDLQQGPASASTHLSANAGLVRPYSASVQLAVALPSIPPTAFGKAKWLEYFGDIGEEPLLPPDIQQILERSCPFRSNKMVKDTHMLVLIPKTVNGVPFTLNALGELIQRPKQGNPTRYLSYCDAAKIELDRPSPKSYWMLMTKKILPGSGIKDYPAQCEFIKDYNKKAKSSYQVPTILEAATSILSEYVRIENQGKDRLYGEDTFTRCQEQGTDREGQIVVGGFCPGGLRILVGNVYGSRASCAMGIAAVQKL